MKLKLLALLTIAAYSINTQAHDIAQTPYSTEAAAVDLGLAGYDLAGRALAIRGNLATGANFVDVVLPAIEPSTGAPIDLRAICYGPKRYVLPHSHDENELFHVTRGGCKFWTLEDDADGYKIWTKSYVAKTGDTIRIPARVIHCLLASSQGLCMHVPWDDRTRSVDFVPTIKAPFEKD